MAANTLSGPTRVEHRSWDLAALVASGALR